MGSIRIDYANTKLSIDYNHQPYEPRGLEYPGCDEEVEVEIVTHKGSNITSLLATSVLDDISKKILEILIEKRTEHLIS